MQFILTPALFSIFRTLVEEHAGLHYSDGDRDLFASKLAGRALEAGFESPLDYYYFLRYDDPNHRALDALCDALVVNETYFFREVDQLRTLCDAILAPLVASGRQPRVWCAACATGEEPLTLAMLLDERELDGKVAIVATDISERALGRAREGIYGGRSLRALEGPARRRWFEPAGEGLAVAPALRSSIAWSRVNLVDQAQVGALGVFDVILCRNVLIYFAEDTVRRVSETLSTALAPKGYLLVGASESLLRFGTLFRCEERAGSFFYRKAAE